MTAGAKNDLVHPHTLLRTDTLHADGTTTSSYRVYCRLQGRSVDAGTCIACARALEFVSEGEPRVECRYTKESQEDRTLVPVGALLRRGAVVVARDATLALTSAASRAAGQRAVGVVDEEGVLVGVVHDEPRGPVERYASAAAVMDRPLTVHESAPVGEALRTIALGHGREATVVDDDGAPLGVLRDVDALAALRWSR